MGAFREHFFEKYFAYRRRYVESVIARAPHRRNWAVVSEIARLGFMIAGNLLCALIFWALVAAASVRAGAGALFAVFLMLALLPTLFALLATRGLLVALGEPRT